MAISINRVCILGRLGADPDGNTTSGGGITVCRMRVATSRMRKQQDGTRQEETEWHNVVLFGRQAETAKQYLTKGSEVYIEGRLQTRSYEKDGVKRYSTEIVAERMQLGARSHDNPAKPAQAKTTAQYAAAKGRDVPDEDVPF